MGDQRDIPSGLGTNESTDRLLPSEFMRGRRPEIFSDTQDRTDYELDAPLLEYHLETLTQRNQTHEFEIFCRKLCERTICPNLRPQSGPDGGGDSKADTETFPVAPEIATLGYVGDAKAGDERWAFAFSAKKTWAQKVRDDVRGLVETGRGYHRIICVTSRFAKAKDLARIEKELTDLYAAPVTILDRSWIVKEVIENGRKDLAFNYLGVGQEITDASRLGPTDYSRLQQLEEIERELADPNGYVGMERQRVIDALLAAKLSRGLERPRTDTDGRFARAIRLADGDGGFHQQLETRYEHIWTAHWWFDDFAALNQGYADLEQKAQHSGHARNLEFLVNLLQLLFSAVNHGHLTREEAQLDQRIASLKTALQPMAEDRERPNNQLEAQTSLLQIQMNEAAFGDEVEELGAVWLGFSELIDRVEGMGEFDVNRLGRLIEAAEQLGGDDPAYGALIEKLAEFVAARTGEAQGALVLLRRAEKLELTNHFEMIRLLSKAAAKLTKKEHSIELIDAMCLLAIAYRSAGLLWASRASCVFAASSMIIEAEEAGRLPLRFAVIMKLWMTVSLDLHHFPDFMWAARLFYGAVGSLPFSDEDKVKFRDHGQELELAAASQFLNLPDRHLAAFASMPDILEAAGMVMPRTALLFTLGYEDLLREDGSIPAAETDEGVARMFSILASQPVGIQGTATGPILNAEAESQVYSTTILGMVIEVRLGGSLNSIVIAETILATVEGFFATAIEQRIMPHTERITISIVESEAVAEPAFEMDLLAMAGTLTWPASLSAMSFASQGIRANIWIDVTARILETTCIVADGAAFAEVLCRNELVLGRMAMLASATNGYHRLCGRYASRLSDWTEEKTQSYPPRDPRPVIERVDLVGMAARRTGQSREEILRGETAAESHRDVWVKSVIDVHAWDQAVWRGTGFSSNEPGYPPFLALLFENEGAARTIFDRWRERIGPYDERGQIRVSIVRNLVGCSPFHYVIQISANPDLELADEGRKVAFTTRGLTLQPHSDEHLENFLAEYEQCHAYYLIPAIWNEATGAPDFLSDMPVLKRELVVVNAENVTRNDIEWMALRSGEAEDS